MIHRVKIENPTGDMYRTKVTNADTGEEISISRLEIFFDMNLSSWIARIDIPAPILDLVVPVKISEQPNEKVGAST